MEAIEKQGIAVQKKAGEVIMEYGTMIKSLPLIMEGAIKVVRKDEEGNELFLYYLYPGETCAMSLTCCLAHQKSEIRAVAEEDSSFIAIPISFLETWSSEFPEWKNFIFNSYSHRFKDLLITIDNIAFKKMDERIMEYLFAKKTAHQNHELYLTHLEIAKELSTSREVISRLLKQLEKQGKIKLGRNKIEVNF